MLYEIGRPDEAAASYNQALAIRPDHAEAHNNLGTALYALGKLDEALACYRRAVAVKPQFVAAHIHLGTVLWEQERLEDAAAAYRRAIAIDPCCTDALYRFAAVTMMQGEAAMALDTIQRSLEIAQTDRSKKLFVDIVRRMGRTSDDGKIRTAVSRALTEPWARPGELARAGADLIKRDPVIGACVGRAAQTWPRRLSMRELFGALDLAVLSADPLLCDLLTSTQNSDIALERFLTMARRLMLEDAAGLSPIAEDAGAALPFYSALARQCFINEYVFALTADEIRQANDLRDSLAQALETEKRVPALWMVAAAAYFPLHAVAFGERLLDRQWSAPVTAILTQQIAEPQEEARLRANIAPLTVIADPVSRRVRNQYEENPYPRWVRLPSVQGPMPIAEYLRRKFPQAHLRHQDSGNCAELLSAGCGTGQFAIELAMGIKARVLAVDLSLGSLGYCGRKARELELKSVEYAQADLLELGACGRRFDVIECSGVLHHMADPFAGWAVLLSLLRPGGFMLVGLYSELARRDITRARRLIAAQGSGTSAEEIRRCRQELLDLDEQESLGITTRNSDFFGISTCRDLLFPSQEITMTLKGIASFLRDNGLTFLGFEIGDEVRHAYRKRFADDPAATNLAHWQAFEADHPSTFVGMYIFWVQKAG